jgi:hypothetical protein
MFVSRSGDGTCILCAGTGPFAQLIGDPANNRCGTTISIEEFKNIYNKLRNGFSQFDLQKILGNFSGANLLGVILQLASLAQDACGLADEYYHLLNKYSCYHHLVCDESRSTESNFNCSNDPSIVAFIAQLLAWLDRPNLFTGVENERDRLKKAIIETYCGNLAGMPLTIAIESCLCCSTRDGTEGITPKDCADCAAKYCPLGTFTQTQTKSPSTGLPAFCKGFDENGAKKKKCEYFLTGTGPHTCEYFMNTQLPKPPLNISTLSWDSITSITGGVTCPINPKPAPTCAPGSSSGDSTSSGGVVVCIDAPPV